MTLRGLFLPKLTFGEIACENIGTVMTMPGTLTSAACVLWLVHNVKMLPRYCCRLLWTSCARTLVSAPCEKQKTFDSRAREYVCMCERLLRLMIKIFAESGRGFFFVWFVSVKNKTKQNLEKEREREEREEKREEKRAKREENRLEEGREESRREEKRGKREKEKKRTSSGG